MARTSARTVKAIKIPSIKLPKVNFKFNVDNFLEDSKAYTPILLVLLLISSFLLGALTTKLSLTNKTAGQTETIGTTPQTAPNVPVQITPGAKVNVSDGHLPVLGSKDAKVHLVEFADLRCPFCEQFFTQTESQILKDYVDSGKVTFSFRHYAFLGPASTVAANAAECANEQGKFWDFHNYIYKNQPPETDTSMYTVDNLTKVAGDLGMNSSQFSSCLSANKYQSNINKDLSDGQAAGVSGTPTIFVNGVAMVGAQPYDTFKTTIDRELSKVK